jgi:hypothetical protein
MRLQLPFNVIASLRYRDLVPTTKRKLTVYLDPEVARAAKVRAARLDKRDSEVIEDALRAHLGIAALDEAQRLSTLTEDEALKLANAEVHAARSERRKRR